MAGVSCLAFFFDVSAAFESIGTDRVPIFDRPVSGRETLSQLVFVLALHFVQHLPPSLPFSVLALSLLRISIIPDPTGSPWMPMTVRGCVPLCMYLDNEKCVYGILLRRISCFRVDTVWRLSRKKRCFWLSAAALSAPPSLRRWVPWGAGTVVVCRIQGTVAAVTRTQAGGSADKGLHQLLPSSGRSEPEQQAELRSPAR